MLPTITTGGGTGGRCTGTVLVLFSGTGTICVTLEVLVGRCVDVGIATTGV